VGGSLRLKSSFRLPYESALRSWVQPLACRRLGLRSAHAETRSRYRGLVAAGTSGAVDEIHLEQARSPITSDDLPERNGLIRKERQLSIPRENKTAASWILRARVAVGLAINVFGLVLLVRQVVGIG